MGQVDSSPETHSFEGAVHSIAMLDMSPVKFECSKIAPETVTNIELFVIDVVAFQELFVYIPQAGLVDIHKLYFPMQRWPTDYKRCLVRVEFVGFSLYLRQSLSL